MKNAGCLILALLLLLLVQKEVCRAQEQQKAATGSETVEVNGKDCKRGTVEDLEEPYEEAEISIYDDDMGC